MSMEIHLTDWIIFANHLACSGTFIVAIKPASLGMSPPFDLQPCTTQIKLDLCLIRTFPWTQNLILIYQISVLYNPIKDIYITEGRSWKSSVTLLISLFKCILCWDQWKETSQPQVLREGFQLFKTESDISCPLCELKPENRPPAKFPRSLRERQNRR